MTVLRGRCACGATEYEVEDAFVYAMNCHCSKCRAATGAAYKPMGGIEREKLRITRADQPLFVWGEADAGDFRCGVCGSLSLLDRPRRQVGARHFRLTGGRADAGSLPPHLRRLEGAVGRDSQRVASTRGLRSLAWSAEQLYLHDGFEYLGVLGFGRITVGVDEQILLTVVDRLERCSRFDVDQPTRRKVLSFRGVAEVHRQRSGEYDKRLLLKSVPMAATRRARLEAPDVRPRMPYTRKLA